MKTIRVRPDCSVAYEGRFREHADGWFDVPDNVCTHLIAQLGPPIEVKPDGVGDIAEPEVANKAGGAGELELPPAPPAARETPKPPRRGTK